MAECADEADELVLGAERTGKGYLEQTMERERRNDGHRWLTLTANSDVPHDEERG